MAVDFTPGIDLEKEKRRHKRIFRFFEFFIVGFLFGVVEDLIVVAAATDDSASAAVSSAHRLDRRRAGEAVRTALRCRTDPAAGTGRETAVGSGRWVRSRAAAAVDQPGRSAGLLEALVDRANLSHPLENRGNISLRQTERSPGRYASSAVATLEDPGVTGRRRG